MSRHAIGIRIVGLAAYISDGVCAARRYLKAANDI